VRLENKVAIVTGGAQGLGEAYSIGMAREGASVVIADVDELSGHKLEELIRNSGGKALFVRTDVSRKADTGGRYH
jgi:NAD(P)-dependent dehydrogenase (short-subunit alcohol dehydrogenase family)